MKELSTYQQQLSVQGFTIIPDIFSTAEVTALVDGINAVDDSSSLFRRSSDLFAIRQFLKEVPAVTPLVFTTALKAIISQLFGDHYFVVKSIYFDKPEQSNWFVAYHQDLTISVDKKTELEGFGPWTTKHNQFAVQPPLDILERNFTIRLHLDDTDRNNGALKVVPGSHRKGVYRPETIDWNTETEVFCEVPRGGIMIMRPLLLHASNRTTNQARRRVIHIEFSNTALPGDLQWSEAVANPTHPA